MVGVFWDFIKVYNKYIDAFKFRFSYEEEIKITLRSELQGFEYGYIRFESRNICLTSNLFLKINSADIKNRYIFNKSNTKLQNVTFKRSITVKPHKNQKLSKLSLFANNWEYMSSDIWCVKQNR